MKLNSVRNALQSSTILTAVSLAFITLSSPAHANPVDGQVVAGDATIATTGSSTLVVQQHSQNVVLEWGSFNIKPGETTRFEQPNAAAWALNRVVGSQDPSVIAGTLSANGNIAIVNPDGIVFSQGSRVDVNGLVATTADIGNDDFMRGDLSFNLPGNPAASVINEGYISIRDHGLAAFVAPGVRNSGVIMARFGTVSLAAGNTFAIDLYGDGLISLAIGDEITKEVIDVATGLPMSDLVKNEGTIVANGGIVALTAATARTVVNSVINNTGVIEANTVGIRNGKIILAAQTETSRPATAPRQTVRVSGQLRTTALTTSLRPAARPGSGGTVEITGEDIQITGATIDASGANGGGTVLIGGDYLGGRVIIDLFPIGEELREDYTVATAATVTVDNDTTINASATETGDGGKVILWSDEATTASTDIFAAGAGDGAGGFIETSSAGTLSLPEGYVTAGAGGMWLLDPRFITVGTSDSVTGDNQFVSATTISASLNSGSDVILVATGTNAELAVYSNIRKTSGGDARLLLGSTGSALIAADIVSISGELEVVISVADVYDNIDSSGQVLAVPSGLFLLIGGHTINTNGGQFAFRGAQFQSANYTEGGQIGEPGTTIPPGRIVTEGGNITFAFSPESVARAGYAGFFGCDGSSTGCGLAPYFVLDAQDGRIAFGVNSKYTPTGPSDLPQVFVGDLGIRTTGELLIDNVVVKSYRPTNRNGIHNVEFGTLTLRNDGEMDFPFADVPGLEAALAVINNEAPQSVQGVTLDDFEFTVGEQVRYYLPQLFTDDGLTGTLRLVPISLPAGLRLERISADLYALSGTFEGTPGSYPIIIRAVDSHGATSEITLSVTFAPTVVIPKPVDTPPSVNGGNTVFPNVEVSTEEYSVTTGVLFSDDNGVGGLRLIVSGLPAGWRGVDNGDGTVTISGTPTVAGAVNFNVTATDAGGNSISTSTSFVVNDPTVTPPEPPTTGLENGTAGPPIYNANDIQANALADTTDGLDRGCDLGPQLCTTSAILSGIALGTRNWLISDVVSASEMQSLSNEFGRAFLNAFNETDSAGFFTTSAFTYTFDQIALYAAVDIARKSPGKVNPVELLRLVSDYLLRPEGQAFLKEQLPYNVKTEFLSGLTYGLGVSLVAEALREVSSRNIDNPLLLGLTEGAITSVEVAVLMHPELLGISLKLSSKLAVGSTGAVVTAAVWTTSKLIEFDSTVRDVIQSGQADLPERILEQTTTSIELWSEALVRAEQSGDIKSALELRNAIVDQIEMQKRVLERQATLGGVFSTAVAEAYIKLEPMRQRIDDFNRRISPMLQTGLVFNL